MFKLVIILMLLGVIGSLFSGLFFLCRGQGGDRAVKALTLRIGLSIALFAMLMLGYKFGLISSHSL
ncbi:twin transmembrane helix small protein [Uliginosibacterium flavum]|uniref:Twin transmembrane helix small protein n=1 Tax=Uliginosibacterium flavum TaxID=1396831 RepID=A0ABV2TKS4_9RHOO